MKRKKVLSIIGARPQFIKYAALSKALRDSFDESSIHTGQHYDPDMSDIFFQQLKIPTPNVNLEIGSHSHGVQTGEMLKKLDPLLQEMSPDLVLVYGDTNSTLAGAICAAKLHIPVAHVEAGLRSYNKSMPEEINRVVADNLSELLLCPTKSAVKNLAKENITTGVSLVGDIMNDILQQMRPIAEEKSNVLTKLGLEHQCYYVCTVHRAENTDAKEVLTNIFESLLKLQLPVIIPLHPRTKKLLSGSILENIMRSDNIRCIEPLSYLDMLKLQGHAKAILTDSGGIQKEAYLLEVPCITLRQETEWVETLQGRWNSIAGSNQEKILAALSITPDPQARSAIFGTGDSASKITQTIHEYFTQ